MKKTKKIFFIFITIMLVSAIMTLSIFAQSGTFGNQSQYSTSFNFSDAFELNASGNCKNIYYPSYTMKMVINAYAQYLNGGYAYGSDPGLWIGNPATAAVHVEITSTCEYAFAEYHLHENNVYLLTVSDSWYAN